MRWLKPLLLGFFWLLPAQNAAAESLVLGSIDTNIRGQFTLFRPLAEYLEVELAAAGISEVKIEVMPDAKSMAGALWRGDVDIFFENPVLATKVARDSGATPFLRQWVDGSGTYRSLVIVPKDSPAQNLADLRGRKIAFANTESSSGFLLPASMIVDHDIELVRLKSRKNTPPPDAVGYLFTSNNKNSVYWLIRGWADAAAVNNLQYDHLQRITLKGFRVIAESQSVPSQVVLHRPKLNPDWIAAIETAFVDMHQNGAGERAAKAFSGTTRFEGFRRGFKSTFASYFAILDRLTVVGLI